MQKVDFLCQLEKYPYRVFLCLFIIALILRFHTFIPITLDRDEATYAVFADHLLNGSELYKDIQDIKPPGIFVIYCGIQLLFGKSLWTIRLMSILVVSSSAFFLYLFKRKRGFDLVPSLLTGIVYILIFNYFFGLSGNTELYFIWCFSLGLLTFSYAKGLAGFFSSGLIIGIGFIIKQHIAFDFAALGLFFLISSIQLKSFWKNFPNMTLMVVGFLLPFLLVNGYFYFIGNWEYYHYVTYVAPGNYSATHHLPSIARFNLNALLMFSPFILMGVLSWREATLDSSFRVLILLLILFDLIAVNLTGKPFKHYLLQLAVPIALLAGEAYQLKRIKRFFDKGLVQKLAIGLMLLYALTLSVVYKYYRFDSGRELVSYFESRMKDSDTLYAADAPTILYWFFGKKSPTKFIHSTLMVFPQHIEELGIDVNAELNRILSGHPTYVVISDRYPHKWFVNEVKASYSKVADLKKYTVYQIKDE